MRALKIIVSTALLTATAAAWAGSDPGTGIQGTRHDWSSPVTTNPTTGVQSGGRALLQWLNPTGGDATTGWTYTGATATTYKGPNAIAYIPDGSTTQGTARVQIGLCTTCHTPHQAKSQTLLWNHTLLSTQYKWDDPNTTAGTPYSTFKADTYRGATTKCLSCHDGLLSSTDGMWFGRQFVSTAKHKAGTYTLDSGHYVANGANLSKSHPVAMPYPINGASNTYNGVANGNNVEPTEWIADPMATNRIRLFNDDGTGKITAGVVAGKTGIECSSCHDVHNGTRVKDVHLLTGKLTGSDTAPGGYICTQCHKK